MKYLDKQQLATALSLGKPVEQWIGVDEKSDYTVIKWLRIDKEKDGTYSLSYFQVFDEGSEGLLDIYEFHAVNPDEQYGKIDSFDTADNALYATYSMYDAKPDKFVNGGLIQSLYNEYLLNK